MIKNDRQAGIVRGRVERLMGVKKEIEERVKALSGDDRALAELEMNAVASEIDRMEEDLTDYQALKEGRAPVGVARTLVDLPRLLIRARIAEGLTHSQLAERLGLKEQQIQRYESTDYESASLSRLIEVATVLGLRFSTDLNFEPGGELPTEDPNQEDLLATLSKAGLDVDFIKRRIGVLAPGESSGLISRLSHVFGWLPEDLAAREVSLPRAAAVAYKKPKRASELKTAFLAAYGHYLAETVCDVVVRAEGDLPEDPIQFHNLASHRGGGRVTLRAVLDVLWDHGTPVIPLREPGAFDAGYYRLSSGQDAIVVNSVRREEARWVFYILHDVGHIVDPSIRRQALLEQLEGAVDGDAWEERASHFASEAIFGGRSQSLFEHAMKASEGKIGLLQRAVRFVARQENVDVGALALHVAFRLAEQGTNWWGAANNLQSTATDPFELAREVLIERLDWARLEPIDADILGRALEVTPPLVASSGGIEA